MVVRLPDDPNASANAFSNRTDSVSFKVKFFGKLIFLPFNPVWQAVVQTCVVALIFLIVYRVYFTRSFDVWDFILFYTFQFIFLMDTVLAIMHRYMKELNKFALYVPRNIFLLAIDIFSVLPIYEFYLIMFPVIAKKMHFYIIFKNFLRIIHLIHYVMSKKSLSTLGYLLLVITSHTIYSILVSLAASVMWCEMRCYPNCVGPNWSTTLKYYDMDLNVNENMFVICYTKMLNIVNHNSLGFSVDTTNVESLMLIFFMLTGATMHIIVATGHITKIQLQRIGWRFDYMQMLSMLHWILADWKTTPSMKKKIIDFYTIIWKKRNGIVSAPESVDLLPISVQKEIFVDIFWEALRHSHLFCGLDMSVKRELGLFMQSEYLLPGDYLMKTGMPKTRMIYIVSGIVQMLSLEDDASPLISFSGGTLLSEINCILVTNCKSNFRCATDCEIQTLSLHSMTHILIKYTKDSRYIHDMIYERISDSRDLRSSKNLAAAGVHRLKKNWRYVSTLNRSHKRKKVVDKDVYKVDPSFHFEYMDLLVLSDKVDLQMSSICLHDKCSYVIEPSSSFSGLLYNMHLIVVFIQSIVVPLVTIFEMPPPSAYVIAGIIFDNIYMLDIYIQLITAVKTNNLVITDSMEIVLYKLKSPLFMIDVVASIPFDLFASLMNASATIRQIAKAPKVFKCYKILNFILKVERSLKYNYIFVIIIKYTYTFFMAVYYTTCFYYMAFCFGKGCVDKSILESSPLGGSKRPMLAAIIYGTDKILATAASSRTAINSSEMITNVVVSFVGRFMYSFFLSELTATIIKTNEQNSTYRDYLSLLAKFMVNNSMPTYFRQTAMHFYTFKWFISRNVDIRPNTREDYTKQESLVQEMVLERIVAGIKLIPMFNNYPPNILYKMAHMGVIRTIPPGTVICEVQERPIHFYIILRGYCVMQCLMPGDVEKHLTKILTIGDAFPVLEAFHNVDCLNTITALTSVEIICMDLFQVSKVMRILIKDTLIIHQTLEWHMQKYRSILSGGASMTQQKVQTKSKIGNPMFSYGIDDVTFYKVKPKKNVRFGFFGHLLIARTLNPHDKFFIGWESFRSCVAIIYVLVFLLYDSLLMDYVSYNMYTLITIRIILVIDCYIRMHVQYHNSKNIFVTDHYQTAAHYLKHSFFTDILPCLPLYEFNVCTVRSNTFWATSVNLLIRVVILAAILYRPIIGLTYIEKMHKGAAHSLAFTMRFLILLVTIAILVSNHILMATCVLNNGEYSCDGSDNIISTSSFAGTTDTNKLFLLCLYAVIERFGLSFVGVSECPLFGNVYDSLLILTFLWVARIFIIAGITGIAIGGHPIVIKHRNKVTNFMSFVSSEMVSEEKVTEFVGHFDYIWNRTDGINMDALLDEFYPRFQNEIKVHLFLATLKNAYFFEHLHINSYTTFLKHFKLVHFKKDATIIRCNDIQQTLYFISKGEVDVVLANHHLGTLKRGASFGSLSKTGPTRQTITVTAKFHVDLLAIDSNLFHELLVQYPNMLVRVNNSISLGHEYLSALDVFDTQKVEVIHHKATLSVSSMDRAKQKCINYYAYFNRVIDKDSRWYKCFNYFLLVHFSPLTCFMLLMLHFLNVEGQYLHIYCFMTDIPFIIYTFINFHMHFIDPESGMKVTQPSIIIKRYAKSLTFWLDLLSLFPIDYLFLMCGAPQNVVMLATLNKLIRFFHLFVYYNACSRQLKISLILQWTYIFYLVLFEFTVMSLIWYKIACPNDSCRYKVSSGPTIEYATETTKVRSVVLAFYFTVNIFTATGMRTVAPNTYSEIGVSIMISLLSIGTLSLMCGAFTSLLLINNVSRNQYQVNSHKLKTYVERRGLSNILVKKIETYMSGLWQIRRGELMPALLHEAPAYLRQDIMGAMYGYHIENHFLFRATHIDFIRQLNVHLKLCMYTAGQGIADRGDVDEHMYFVHRGEVKEIDMSGAYTMKGPGTSFGEKQGLYNVAHTETYVAYTTVDIISLKKSEWEYLLDWFPASKEIIYNILKCESSQSSMSSYSFDLP